MLAKSLKTKSLQFKQPRLVAAIALFCLVLNSFAVSIPARGIDYESLSKAIACQSDYLYFFTFSSLPISILNSLMETKDRPATKKNDAPNRNPDSHAEQNPGITGPRLSAMENFKRITALWTSALTGVLILFSATAPPGRDLLRNGISPGSAVWLIPCATTFFFLLPRSSINEDSTLLSYGKCIRPGFCRAGFFIL